MYEILGFLKTCISKSMYESLEFQKIEKPVAKKNLL